MEEDTPAIQVMVAIRHMEVIQEACMVVILEVTVMDPMVNPMFLKIGKILRSNFNNNIFPIFSKLLN